MEMEEIMIRPKFQDILTVLESKLLEIKTEGE